MKKVLFFLFFLGIATSFFYCSKKSGDSPNSGLIQKTPGDNNIGRLKADDGGGSTNCNCAPGFSSCIAGCRFSECCICWNPEKSEGACGCFFGVARCKTALIGASSVSSEPHNIKLFHHRFEKYLEFLNQIPFNSKPLADAFKVLLKNGIPDSKSSNGEVILVNENNYDAFYKSYTKYVESLTETERKLLVEYINRANEKE